MELVVDNKYSKAAGIKGISIKFPRPNFGRGVRGVKDVSKEAVQSNVKAAVAAKAVVKSAEKPATDVIAGGTARCFAQATIHPIDTIKVRMQAAAKSSVAGKQASPKLSFADRLSGTASLYKGCGTAASCAGIIIAAHFAFYGAASRFLKEKTDLPSGQVAFVAGGFGALGSSFLKIPMAVCIRSVQANVYPNAITAARSITKKGGPFALFTGILPALLEDVPDTAIKFGCYEMFRSTHTKVTGRSRQECSVAEDLAMGGLAGSFAAAATTPFDCVKTRMMCSAAARPTAMKASVELWKMGGVKPFFTGVVPRAASNGINSAVFFCFFEALRTVIKELGEKEAVKNTV